MGILLRFCGQPSRCVLAKGLHHVPCHRCVISTLKEQPVTTAGAKGSGIRPKKMYVLALAGRPDLDGNGGRTGRGMVASGARGDGHVAILGGRLQGRTGGVTGEGLQSRVCHAMERGGRGQG